ncbi:hypothetical protein AVEN_32751-1 [Araneus ventricosus]|uniref:Uncharacterized protein n=1 Tax=Araneus ventricosus TaxID=182803 RepID=A0A4Y2CW77_ARAVE|nr:hypothetical protein AVEN_32751-1 [Araneus ventricosus]
MPHTHQNNARRRHIPAITLNQSKNRVPGGVKCVATIKSKQDKSASESAALASIFHGAVIGGGMTMRGAGLSSSLISPTPGHLECFSNCTCSREREKYPCLT